MHGLTEVIARSPVYVQTTKSRSPTPSPVVVHIALKTSSLSLWGSFFPCPGAQRPDLLRRSSPIIVANLWRLHAQSLATGTMRYSPMCDLSVSTVVPF